MANHYQPSAVLRDNAKGFLNGKYRGTTLLTIFIAGVSYAAAMLMVNLNSIITAGFLRSGAVSFSATMAMYIIRLLLSAALSVVLSVFSFGTSIYYLKLGTGQTARLADAFYGYKENFSRNIIITLAVNGPMLLFEMISTFLQQLYSDYGNVRFLIAAIVFTLIGLVVTVYVEMSLEIVFFIIADFPDYTAKQALSAAWNKMNGHRVRLFKLFLSLIPYYLLAVLSFGIGLIWVIPFSLESVAQFYLDLMNPKKVSGEWERTV
ncbi:MAG: DUF975 family protein [Lachnospiraceae bacterium]|nr:DUF975 family protein [Lachnospiraceae bacterium]